MKNDHLYNDKELWEEGDLNWYDYGFRNYDPQIGRFPQLDPLTWDYPELTNYQYASNEPIANIDLDGLEKCPSNIGGIVAGQGGKAGSSFISGIVSIATKTATVTVNKKNDKNLINKAKAGLNHASVDAQKAKDNRRKLEERFEAERQVDEWDRLGMWDKNLTDEEAGMRALGLGTGLLIPTVIIKPAVIATNLAKVSKPVEETLVKVYRVFGGKAGEFGESWTPINPKFFGKGYRKLAGLPDANDGDKMIEGFVKWSDIDKLRPSLPYDGNPGGLPEFIIKDASKKIINPTTTNLKTRF